MSNCTSGVCASVYLCACIHPYVCVCGVYVYVGCVCMCVDGDSGGWRKR